VNRRNFIILGTAGGLGLSLATHHLLAKNTTQNPDADTQDKGIQEPLLRFVAVADTGTGTKGQYAVAKAMTSYLESNPFQLILLAGDNIYNNGEINKIKDVFEKPYETLLKKKVRFQAALGNHDIRTNNGKDEIKYSGFNMQGRYYTFTKKPVQFFALDTNKNAPWEEQLKWLEENLAKSSEPWKVVYGHHPVYSAGVHGDTLGLAERLTPLFYKYGVQLYICGHDHNYERTKPIEGTTYLVCGAGAGTRIVGSSPHTAYSVSELSFAGLEVYPNRLEIRGIDTDGLVFDTFSILADKKAG
jgi:3',5'-cyclic AMP phosphodiesterase CpdA